MSIDIVSKHLSGYFSEPIVDAISPTDQMFSGDETSYMAIGKSAIEAILPALSIVQKKDFNKVLDFGCGYGRVGRHLRALFKDSNLDFTDIKQEAVDFCADAFSGRGFLSSTDFDQLKFPSHYDFIWVGSVFTHIDYNRQQKLFARLVDALVPGGVLVLTFHGRRCIEMKNSGKIAYIEEGRWNRIVSSYHSQGIGYERYGREDLGDWGISLNSLESMLSLKHPEKETRIISLAEAGWANHQDVIAVCAS